MIFNRAINRRENVKPATSVGFRGISADRTDSDYSALMLQIQFVMGVAFRGDRIATGERAGVKTL
jgi:hypothetical protein